MPNFKAIADQIERGMFQEDWNKVKAQKEAIKGEQQRQLLANSANTRAEAAAGREAEDFGNKKSGWADEAILRALGVTSAKQKNETGAFDLAHQGEKYNLDKTAKEQEIASSKARIEQGAQGLKLEGGRLALAQADALRMKGATEAQIKAIEADLREKEATSAGRIENTNFQNSEQGRKDAEMSYWANVLKQMDPGDERSQAIVDYLMGKKNIQVTPKPGILERLGGATTAKRPPQKVIGSQGARLPGMGPR